MGNFDFIEKLIAGCIAIPILVICALPVAMYQASLDFERRGCYYTGETEARTRLQYNVATKTSLPVPYTAERYECNEGAGGWT